MNYTEVVFCAQCYLNTYDIEELFAYVICRVVFLPCISFCNGKEALACVIFYVVVVFTVLHHTLDNE